MAFSQDLETLATAGRLARDLYRADAETSGRAVVDWPALDWRVQHAYVDRAVLELESRRVVPFPGPRPAPVDLVPHAVQAIRGGIADLVTAANGCDESEIHELHAAVTDLRVQLESVLTVLWHREQMFFPKGA